MALANPPGPLFSSTYETGYKPIQTYIKDFWHVFGTHLGVIPNFLPKKALQFSSDPSILKRGSSENPPERKA
jgi:hypothetical protein